ncbi:hypothetical protein H6G64_32395 [Calothrix sp. FACHB-156]|nr:hypothetical protein [Calothrix sp. FACHB-156]
MVVEFPKFAKKTPEKNSTINRSQVLNHLEALGYKLGAEDTVYLRSFYPNDDPRKAEDKGRSAQVDDLEQLTKVANTWQREGKGVYFVVNGGGRADKDVTSCRAIFYEHDDLDKQSLSPLLFSVLCPIPGLLGCNHGRRGNAS